MVEKVAVINRKKSAAERIVDRALEVNLRYKTIKPTTDLDGNEVAEGTELIFVLNFGLSSVYLVANDEHETFISLANDETVIAPVQPKLTLAFGSKQIGVEA